MAMKNVKVTYFLGGEEFTDTMSEGQYRMFEERIENGTAEEQLVYVEEIKAE
jgi:hypothetical protein